MKVVSICCLMVVLIVVLSFTSISAVQTHPDSRPVDHPNEDHHGATSGRRVNSRLTAKNRGLDLSPVINKITNYISSYTSTTATWLSYPYYGISTGVTSVIVTCVVIFMLIIVSGTAVTTGRSLSDLGVDHEELDRLTHTITKAFDFMIDHLGNSKLNDPHRDRTKRDLFSSDSGPSWSASISTVDSVSEYISEHFYDKLIWLSKPYAGYILSLGAIILYMVVIVIIVMTGGVFPISTSGRQLHGSGLESNIDTDLIRTAETVMEAINLWDARKRHDSDGINPKTKQH